MMRKFKIKHYGKWILGIGIAMLLVTYLVMPDFRSSINQIFAIFDPSGEAMISFIQSYGIYAIIVSFLLMMFQSVMAPLPAFIITFANAALFGWWQGAILSFTSAMAGAALCFYISRVLGRDAATKFAPSSALSSIDYFFDKYGSYAIVVCRLLPFVSFDIVSYAAGLTSIGFVGFFVATGIGQLPATIVYSYVGGALVGGSKMLVSGLFILFAVSILGFMLKKIFDDRKAKNKE